MSSYIEPQMADLQQRAISLVPESATVPSLLFLTLIFFLILVILVMAVSSIDLERNVAREIQSSPNISTVNWMDVDLEKGSLVWPREVWWKDASEKGGKEVGELLLR